MGNFSVQHLYIVLLPNTSISLYFPGVYFSVLMLYCITPRQFYLGTVVTNIVCDWTKQSILASLCGLMGQEMLFLSAVLLSLSAKVQGDRSHCSIHCRGASTDYEKMNWKYSAGDR